MQLAEAARAGDSRRGAARAGHLQHPQVGGGPARVFLLEELPPWHSHRLSRLVKTPKLHVGDTGLVCALLGLDADALMQDRATLGQLLETFVLQELRRQASWHAQGIRFHHYRDKDGGEVESAVANPKQCLCSEGAAPSITAAVIDLRCQINLK